MDAEYHRAIEPTIDLREEWRLLAVASAEAALDCLRQGRIDIAADHITRAKRCIERLAAT